MQEVRVCEQAAKQNTHLLHVDHPQLHNHTYHKLQLGNTIRMYLSLRPHARCRHVEIIQQLLIELPVQRG